MLQKYLNDSYEGGSTMSIGFTTEASLDLGELKDRIKTMELKAIVRLADLVGKTVNDFNFNAHKYEMVKDNTWPFSELFVLGQGFAAEDTVISAYLMNKRELEIVCEGPVYAGGTLTKVAVVGKKPVKASSDSSKDLGATDKDHISSLIKIATSSEGIAEAQKIAGKALADAGLDPSHNACAATLSAFLRLSGIDVPMTLGAAELAYTLGGQIKSRHWGHISIGDQQAGDVGVTFNDNHIYLVVQRIDNDEMVIADNQAPSTHPRSASGKDGKTKTGYFLRAPA
jgi:hypothetical protein